MTDLQKVTALFSELGIEYTTDTDESGCVRSVCLTVDGNKADSKIKGYNGFSTAYMFSESGNFLEVNIWE